MKKYLLYAFLTLIIGQYNATPIKNTEEIKTQFKTLLDQMTSFDEERIDRNKKQKSEPAARQADQKKQSQELLAYLKISCLTFDSIITYAIENSKDILGSQDTDLINAATDIRQCYHNILETFKNYLDNNRRPELLDPAKKMCYSGGAIYSKVNRKYITKSKQNASFALQYLVNALTQIILPGLQTEYDFAIYN